MNRAARSFILKLEFLVAFLSYPRSWNCSSKWLGMWMIALLEAEMKIGLKFQFAARRIGNVIKYKFLGCNFEQKIERSLASNLKGKFIACCKGVTQCRYRVMAAENCNLLHNFMANLKRQRVRVLGKSAFDESNWAVWVSHKTLINYSVRSIWRIKRWCFLAHNVFQLMECDSFQSLDRFHLSSSRNVLVQSERRTKQYQHFYYRDATLIDQVRKEERGNLEARREKQVETLHKSEAIYLILVPISNELAEKPPECFMIRLY